MCEVCVVWGLEGEGRVGEGVLRGTGEGGVGVGREEWGGGTGGVGVREVWGRCGVVVVVVGWWRVWVWGGRGGACGGGGREV